MSASQDILNQVQQVLSNVKQVDLSDKATLGSNFIFLYHTMKASENLLKVAANNASTEELRQYCIHHLAEEKSHEKWLAEDLLSVGIDVTKTIIPIEAVEMCGSIYYLICHLDACALLGYMLLMECFPMNLSLLGYYESIHGKQLFRTARYHAENDISHGKDILEMIDKLPPTEQSIVKQTAFQSAIYFNRAIERLL